MTDIRSRHYLSLIRTGLPECGGCHAEWPCDAIREADRADLEEDRADLAESMLSMCRADLAKAEDALAECRAKWDRTHSQVERDRDEARAQRDAARSVSAEWERRAERAESALAAIWSLPKGWSITHHGDGWWAHDDADVRKAAKCPSPEAAVAQALENADD
jgi:hypothetical protein